jgi:hypothetical protein
MHLGHETKGMAASVVLPMLLFIWAITAFLWEGKSWNNNQNYVNDKNKESQKEPKDKKTSLIQPKEYISTEINFL